MSKSSFKSLFRALDTQARDYPEAGLWGLSRKMVPIFQVGFGYARSLVSLGLEGCAGRIEAVVHADVKSSVSWQAHSMAFPMSCHLWSPEPLLPLLFGPL